MEACIKLFQRSWQIVLLLGGLVNEIQSAFVADKQILDGPFILNELVQWCKKKKKQLLVFKVEFEKEYDSVRWNHLDDIMRNFGFGEKWCMWIQSCHRSSRGSVIVNGSPTKEFQFYKGLKQGDPLSFFLFILVMESLRISFQRVVDVGLFKGIELAPSLNLSYMFYADDAILMGQWSESNIDIIVKVLDCFNRAFGLRINMTKSKLLGISVEDDKVKQAAAKIGCNTLKTPFSCLGSKVGGKVKSCYPSLWLDIIHEVEMFKSGGIDLVTLIHSKLGNGANTSFWEVAWRGRSLFKSFFLGSGEFTITSVRKMIDDFMLPEVSSKTPWIKAVPIKVNVLAWKVKLDGLLTRLNISRRDIDIEFILCRYGQILIIWKSPLTKNGYIGS
nr:RNA-directed DNA polymerase, eukaryota [Tanacetum cinerariifolium]